MFDLASLTKPLVTAPLGLELLNLDTDRRTQLGFRRAEPLSVRQLLSHGSGLPAWLPYRPGSLARDLEGFSRWGAHGLLVQGSVGSFLYSDLGYRLLAELLEEESGRPFRELAAAHSGLLPAPWHPAPRAVPDGQDREAWGLACPGLAFPSQGPGLPHDANARAGMQGHAGFGATPERLRGALETWIARGFPQRMAMETLQAADGARWGLGLQMALRGGGRFGDLLERLPVGLSGVHILVEEGEEAPAPAPSCPLDPGETGWWYHLAYTGPALFVRPADGLCIALLAHRGGPGGTLLDAEALRARRWSMLERLLG
nr:serine hydrolase domain-containing protein [uncultured Holophaga sp.]